ncbi:hypothetical protein ACQEVZ_14110 [Dactylosporangium sp. CA-152071]|uniref:hypothetical protein n=1 Tax=Dactylosporangium sp. CA-152071 TaxID=3239933 RepID=UPI003D91C874
MGTFGVPASWLRDILPRRGGAPAGFSPSATWAADIAALLDKRPSLRAALTNAATPADVRTEGLAHLDGGAASTPLGAAAVVAAYVGPPDQRSRVAAAVFADGWVRRVAPRRVAADRQRAAGRVGVDREGSPR